MDKITMLVAQEGPAISRARLQVLTVGTDIDADEAQRLVDAAFAAPGDITGGGNDPTPTAAPTAKARAARAKAGTA